LFVDGKRLLGRKVSGRKNFESKNSGSKNLPEFALVVRFKFKVGISNLKNKNMLPYILMY
jgi:hypothetical protein